MNNKQDSENQTRNNRRIKILDIFSQHRKKDCLLYSKPFENTKSINLFNNTDFFRCVKHLQNKHSEVFYENSAAFFDINLNEAKERIGIIRHLNDLYFIDIEVTRNAEKLYVTVTRLNTNSYSLRHDKYSVEFQNDDMIIAKFGRAKLKRNLDDSPVTMETSINGLKKYFGNIKSVRVKIAIELFVTCNKCHDIISLSSTEGKFLIKTGWYCVTCAKNCVRTCGHVWQDCQFMDIEEKQKKHGLFFCFYRNMCYICRENVRTENGGPLRHYRDKHQNITHLTGDEFRLKLTDGAYCLLEHLGDLFICRYYFNNNEFNFVIRTPWQFEQIKEHCCYITLTPVTKQTNTVAKQPDTRTYEMQRLLQSFDDWRIDIKKWTFNEWPCEFDVTVKFKRIPE